MPAVSHEENLLQGKDQLLEVDTTAFGDSNPFSGQGQGAQDGPPPPYESVIMHDGTRGDTTVGLSHFEIVVRDPVKHGDNSMSAYVSYKVCTNTSLPQYKIKQPEVIRRFRDFAWLRTRLQEQNRGIIIPPLPEKNVVQKYQMTTEFIETRRMALSVFLNRVAAHPALAQSKDLQNFLEASEEDFAIEVARANHESAGGANAAKKTLSSTLQKLKDLGQQTQNLVSGKHTDEEEDPDALIVTLQTSVMVQVREYMFQLEAHLTEAHRQAQRLIKQQGLLGASLAEFGTSVISLGKFEQGRLADDFINLGEKAESLARSSQEQAGSLGVTFEAPLKEYVRMVRSAKAVMADRSLALGALQQARADVDAKRTKLAKLRGTPGIKEEKRSEVERELNDAQHRVEAAKDTYELIVRRMSQELARFQTERATEMAGVLRSFAVAQASLASDTAKAWRTLAPAPSSNGAAR
ncbi:Vps5-domain-containing protein [Coccomyxa subellipsoidea C-169]|uniref:Vps5-domain-containing protein n=1 Tax=Coccomyxa subellipsoidea (strain C-169) TaxID=574566 RepID=I0Z9I0_COCSC|nr:Vps5-domain-containing protein [Coccomyxa subellipsoidea C-169]EIE27299.1 Vps5-domain-containing protein [Coccomyxa subellipsoidea C-169]|eukprot:XP_005651843.1 Vps5-domain-containing protein [Coccomyxa subellipsoidea C-169]